jgi:hypothetical protein
LDREHEIGKRERHRRHFERRHRREQRGDCIHLGQPAPRASGAAADRQVRVQEFHDERLRPPAREAAIERRLQTFPSRSELAAQLRAHLVHDDLEPRVALDRLDEREDLLERLPCSGYRLISTVTRIAVSYNP